jgi:hypothetical protein
MEEIPHPSLDPRPKQPAPRAGINLGTQILQGKMKRPLFQDPFFSFRGEDNNTNQKLFAQMERLLLPGDLGE